MNRFYRCVRRILRVIVPCLFRIKSVGSDNVPEDDGLVLCCNHTSFTDVVFLIMLCPRPISFMGKAELFKNPILSFVLRKMTAFPVQREKSDRSAVKTAKQIVDNGGVLGIFPEGTRKPVGPPARGKAGAAMIALSAGAKVLPVAIYRAGKQRLFGKVTVRFGSPFEVGGDSICEKPSHRLLSDTTSNIMGEISALWEMGY